MWLSLINGSGEKWCVQMPYHFSSFHFCESDDGDGNPLWPSRWGQHARVCGHRDGRSQCFWVSSGSRATYLARTAAFPALLHVTQTNSHLLPIYFGTFGSAKVSLYIVWVYPNKETSFYSWFVKNFENEIISGGGAILLVWHLGRYHPSPSISYTPLFFSFSTENSPCVYGTYCSHPSTLLDLICQSFP